MSGRKTETRRRNQSRRNAKTRRTAKVRRTATARNNRGHENTTGQKHRWVFPPFLAGLVTVLVGVALGWGMVDRVEADRHLLDHGTETTGTVIRVFEERQGRSLATVAVVRFTRADGGTSTFEHTVREGHATSSGAPAPKGVKGEEVRVFHVPSEPWQGYVVDGWQETYRWGPWLVALLLIAGSWVMWRTGVDRHRAAAWAKQKPPVSRGF